MTELDDIQASVLLTIFTSKKKRYKVFFHQNQLIWDREKPPFAQNCVPAEDIIAVKHIYRNSRHPLDDPIPDANSFIIHYAKKSVKNTLKYSNIVFHHKDPLQISSWVRTLQNCIAGFEHRPKNLLLFVNPFGGRRTAMKIYEKIAKPLFEIAGVDVTLNVSQRKNQIRDFVNYHSLDIYDGVGCVGGDGTLSEVFNGLIMRECRLNHLDFDDINVELPRTSIPIGVIPGGSTDTIAYCMHGTTDIPTAVLHILFGNKLGLDVVSVYDANKLLRLYASVLSYGYLGDVAHHSDKYRILGPYRYDYSGFKKIIANKGYEGEIAMLTTTHDDSDSYQIPSKCYENCSDCAQRKDQLKSPNNLMWKTIKGKYFMVSGANISCACARSPNGLAPYSHLGDGYLHLVLVKHTSFFNNIRLLLRLTSKQKDVEDLPFVEIHRAREFCFRALNGQSKWNCDGEVEMQTNIRAKVRCQLLTMYARGPPTLNI